MSTVTIKLTNINVEGSFPPPLTMQEPLIKSGKGVLAITVAVTPGGPSGMYLQVDSGERVGILKYGQAVIATATDSEGKQLQLGPLETIDTGTPAVFKGPYGHFQPGPQQ